MAVYRNVQLSFWTDNKVEDDFTPEDKYFYLYLLTNPQTNICGCYEVSYSQLTHQTGYNIDSVNRLIERFEKVHRLIRFNQETKEILILNWFKYNWSKSESTLKGVESVARYIKCEEFRKYVFDVINCVRTDTPYRGCIGGMVASVSDSDSVSVNINNSNNDVDFEKAWNNTVDRYPKKRREATAKQIWMNRLLAVKEEERKKLATDIYKAIALFLANHRETHSDDEKYEYIPKFDEWLTEDCDYWLRQLAEGKQK